MHHDTEIACFDSGSRRHIIDDNKHVVLVHLDLSFDPYDHVILFDNRVCTINISSVVSSWFHDYMSGRTQMVQHQKRQICY